MQVAVVLIISGIYLRFHMSNILEKELSQKLTSISATIATELDASIVSLLSPGDETTRTYQNYHEKLTALKSAANLERIVVFSKNGIIWLDTRQEKPIGSPYIRMEFDRYEINKVLKGEKASSILFESHQNLLVKSGYSPLLLDGNVIGIVAVLGNANSLKVIRDIQNNILQIGAFAFVFSIVLAFFISKRITSPLSNLQKAAQKIALGELKHPIQAKSKDEIGFLAETMEEMRRAILTRDERQKAMIAGVAHEIRNPLGGIELFAGLIKDDVDNPEMQEKLDKILKETRNLKTLVKNFLDYARQPTPEIRSCLVMNCWKEAKELIEDKLDGITLAEKGDAMIDIDPQHCKQIFLNLALNAIQAFTQEQLKKITIHVTKNDEQITIYFSDNGPGISNDNRDLIFEPFYTTRATGLGLGLSMVKNLVEINQGKIKLIESNEKGTAFQLVFPKAKAHHLQEE
jgi:signal transduction histidine kinase